MLWQWSLLFLVGLLVLVPSGVTLARAGDEIATRTGIGGLLIGMLLVAVATSLPEITAVVAAAATGAGELAVGSLFGSSMGNMAILAVLDFIHRRHVWVSIELGHARVASMAIALTAVAVVGVVTPRGLVLGWVGADTVLIVLAYVAVSAWVRRAALPVAMGLDGIPGPARPRIDRRALRPAGVRFAAATLGIFVAGPLVARSADGIADTTGISATFIGVTLVAVATSLPELVTCLGALRIGAYDLAVGNLFGSNAFNMVVLFLADLAFTDGPILTGGSASLVVAGAAAMGLMAIALAAIVHGEETRIGRLEPDAAVLLVAYAAGLLAVWASG